MGKVTEAHKGRRRLASILVTVACGIATTIVWISRMPPNLAVEARRVFDAEVAGDGATLLTYAFPEEIDANDLTAERLSGLYHRLILPRLSGSLGLPPTTVSANGSKGSAVLSVVSSGGGSVDFAGDVYLVDSGVRSPVTQKLLVAWQKDYFDHHAPRNMAYDRIDAILEGYRRDRKALEELGIKALCDVDYLHGKVNLIHVDRIEEQYSAWRRSLDQQALP